MKKCEQRQFSRLKSVKECFFALQMKAVEMTVRRRLSKKSGICRDHGVKNDATVFVIMTDGIVVNGK